MEVMFHEGIESLSVKENWLVVDGGEMRVWATGDGLRIFKLLKRGRIYWAEQNGPEHADETPASFFMTPLFIRSPVEEKRFFMKWGILPPEVLREKRLPRDVKDIKVETEPFVRLGRTAGAIQYAYGKPAPADGPLPPGLWIEQDAFVIRKMRSPDGSEFTGSDYAPYARNLWLPRFQTILFDNHMVSMRILRVSGIELSNEHKKQLDSSWLRGHPDAGSQFPKSTLALVVQEFYKRFR